MEKHGYREWTDILICMEMLAAALCFFIFLKKEKRLLAAGRSQCDYAVFGQFY